MFDTGRAWIEMPPINANMNHKDVGDYTMQFLLMGEEALINLNIFESVTDYDQWGAYVAPIGLPDTKCITSLLIFYIIFITLYYFILSSKSI